MFRCELLSVASIQSSTRRSAPRYLFLLAAAKSAEREQSRTLTREEYIWLIGGINLIRSRKKVTRPAIDLDSKVAILDLFDPVINFLQLRSEDGHGNQLNTRSSSSPTLHRTRPCWPLASTLTAMCRCPWIEKRGTCSQLNPCTIFLCVFGSSTSNCCRDYSTRTMIEEGTWTTKGLADPHMKGSISKQEPLLYRSRKSTKQSDSTSTESSNGIWSRTLEEKNKNLPVQYLEVLLWRMHVKVLPVFLVDSIDR